MIYLIKFIHIISALSLLGITMYCLVFIIKTKTIPLPLIHKRLLYISLLAMLTGTLLIYPKHFSFATPWIQAAYILVICYASIIALFNRYRDAFLFKYQGIISISYLMLIVLLIVVIHDAVTKSTFLL
jgi:hypothetical protein